MHYVIYTLQGTCSWSVWLTCPRICFRHIIGIYIIIYIRCFPSLVLIGGTLDDSRPSLLSTEQKTLVPKACVFADLVGSLGRWTLALVAGGRFRRDLHPQRVVGKMGENPHSIWLGEVIFCSNSVYWFFSDDWWIVELLVFSLCSMVHGWIFDVRGLLAGVSL